MERTQPGEGVTHVAVDLGASSGRVIAGTVHPAAGSAAASVTLHEVNRFPNGPVTVRGKLHWDVLRLYAGILEGIRAAARSHGVPAGIGIDSWAVDYGLLDQAGELVGNPVHYRDARTAGMVERVHALVPPAELYGVTGAQTQPFNTIFQLEAERAVLSGPQRRMLMIPDLLAYWLTGQEVGEVTNASTTQLLDVRRRAWATELVERLGLDALTLPRLVEPGTRIGEISPDVAAALGLGGPVPVLAVGSHDTASAVVGVPAAEGEHFAYISCGTWSLVGLELPAPVLTPASSAANFTNELGVDGTVRYLRNVMGLWLLQESMRTWADQGLPTDLPTLLADASRVPVLSAVFDVDDPQFLPPGDMPGRIAAAVAATGQVPPQSQAETVRCILDSLALAYRRAVRTAQELSGSHVDVIHLVGGGVRNELLCQLTADATGLRVVAGPVEAAALGNVLVQARATGALAGSLADLRRTTVPDEVRRVHEPSGPPDRWAAAEGRIRG
ncbi:rhamnulokinase family protein [Actinotalea sp. K2]|uniref:rhamnulokinase n=1 Tax=Actinotalea sp. K2 TaxID=2939438 RepID=UPI002017C5AA|nr:rhamnulokinase family protein [Actinotalea sp. K2]MCL3859446.1 rhamnulokinase [Actinotalea sp. K2]